MLSEPKHAYSLEKLFPRNERLGERNWIAGNLAARTIKKSFQKFRGGYDPFQNTGLFLTTGTF